MPVSFVLELNGDGVPEGSKKFVRLPPPVASAPYKLRFLLLAGTKVTRNAVLVLNYPRDQTPFSRSAFQRLPFQGSGVSDFHCDIPITTAGVFEYRVEYSDWDTNEICETSGGSFIVDPCLYLPQPDLLNPTYNAKNRELLPLDAISIVTVIPKWMPTLSKWLPYFHSFSNTGYNMVHFAPVNQRGASDSPYSIFDQLSISADLFEDHKSMTRKQKETEFKNTIDAIYETCGILSITDVVWNHTANNSVWLEEHPESGYNLKNSPNLRPAAELDQAILDFSDSLASVYHKDPNVNSEAQLREIMDLFKTVIIPDLKLWEFYVIDVMNSVQFFAKSWNVNTDDIPERHPYENVHIGSMSLKAKADLLRKDGMVNTAEGRRFAKAIDLKVAIPFVQKYLHDVREVCSAQEARQEFEKILNEINLDFYREYDGDLESILNQITNRARYLRVAEHGPRLGPISKQDPLVDTYFTRLPFNQRTAQHEPDELILANNGWIWNADPLINFASRDSKAYIRREVIPWGDCVKLRYGSGPEDSPWLWDHQKKYTQLMAQWFHGFRIDNCHSTPIHVASYLLDAARAVNPDLYVFAELFTGSEEKDILFVSKLGINSLIREAMSAWGAEELSRQVYRLGEQPMGSFTTKTDRFPADLLGHSMTPYFYDPIDSKRDVFVELKGSAPHALFMDCTHDNETPYQKRTAEDTLPNAAIVAMTNCAIGSVKGYDEIVPELLNVVTETRKYRVPETFEGIIPAKSTLYKIHAKMAKKGYSEMHIHQENDYISIHRVHPVTHDGYLLIARTKFHREANPGLHQPVILRGQSVQVVESATLKVNSTGKSVPSLAPCFPENTEELPAEDAEIVSPQSPTLYYHPLHAHSHRSPHSRESHTRIVGCITGLPCSLEYSRYLTNLCDVSEYENAAGVVETLIKVNPDTFTPGSIVVFKTWMLGSGREAGEVPESVGASVDGLNVTLPVLSPLSISTKGELEGFWALMGLTNSSEVLDIMFRLGYDVSRTNSLWFKDLPWPPGLMDAVSSLTLEEINVTMFRSSLEETDTIGIGLYEVPEFGTLSYGGLQGFITPLLEVARNNDLGHPICENVRSGPWMIDYISDRLKRYSAKFPALKPLVQWMEPRFYFLKRLAPAFVPKYFLISISFLYQALRCRGVELACNKDTAFPPSLDLFEQSCRMTSFQVYGCVESTGLFPIEYPFDLLPPGTSASSIVRMRAGSLAAGLPHFSTHHMRSWGRDVFISLRGLFLIPGHFKEARAHLIAFGSTLRHGLIPNLLDQGIRPRYNARDATWWWLWSVAEYCRMSPEGYKFLKVLVGRRFVPLKRYTNGPGYGKDVPESDEHPHADTYISPEDSLVYKYKNTVAELCHEVLERHARGIKFREWNAGPNLDHAMSSEGFNVSVSTDWDNGTGFAQGGNQYNCGTWMDKMGDSEKARTKGVPATPRDGADIEIVGLQKAVLRWISDEVLRLSDHESYWSRSGVQSIQRGKEVFVSYSSWNKMIQSSFEKYFYIPLNASDDSKYQVDSKLVNRRGIYKDTYGSSQKFGDYQLRPNLCVAMVVAPELFTPEFKDSALEIVSNVLLGPLGIKTLDPADWAYRGTYDNSNDSEDSTVAHGFNYHQGPEWVWVFGMFLRAYLGHHSTKPNLTKDQAAKLVSKVQGWMLPHKLHIANDSFAGLPELTNKDGAHCHGSCPTQAWSSGVMVEVIADLKKFVDRK